jgi:glycine cleavage system H protein
MAEIESTKSVGEVYAPFAGTVAAVNETVSDAPEAVNASPYDEGWLLELEVEGPVPVDGLLDATAYRNLTE